MNTSQITLIIMLVVIFGSVGVYEVTAQTSNLVEVSSTTDPPINTLSSSLLSPPINSTSIRLLPTDTLTLEVKNLSLSDFAITASNQSSYSWTQESDFGLPVGKNYSGYVFMPVNGTTYIIQVTLPQNQSLLIYKDTQLVFNATRLQPVNITLNISSARPPLSSNWSFLFGSLNIKANIPLPSAFDIEIVIIGLGILLMFAAHWKRSGGLMYLGMAILTVVGFIGIGLLVFMFLLVYVLVYVGLNLHDKRVGQT